MDKKTNIITYTVATGIIFYLLDTTFFYLQFRDELTFLQALFTGVPFWELSGRLILLAGILILGLIINGKTKNLSAEDQKSQAMPLKNSQGKLDFHFLTSLTFQIKTPLSAIIGFSELLKKQDLSSESKETYINHISSSSNYLLLLVNNLSEIAKIESNELSINSVECDINKIIENQFHILQTRKEELGKTSVSLEIENEKLNDSYIVITDQKRLNQVIHNLLENALLSTTEGSIKFGYIVKENGFIEFYIMDTGHGFSQERLEVIFERYNKLTDNENLPFDGTVLRLAISKSLVKLLGGDIRADSKIGQGTNIYFTLPNVGANAKPKEEVPVKKVVESNSRDWSKRIILIAEDMESNYVYLEELLRPTKVTILWAKNGKEAVEYVKMNSKVGLVLMDILMPEMDGYQASKEIKKLRKKIPIVAQTACMIEGGDNLAENFDGYLTKPIWGPQLFSAIEKYFI